MCVFERERETKHLQKAIYVITSKEEIGKPSDKPNGARTYGGSIPDGNSIRFLVDPAVKWVPASSRDLGDGKVAGERRREGPSQKADLVTSLNNTADCTVGRPMSTITCMPTCFTVLIPM